MKIRKNLYRQIKFGLIGWVILSVIIFGMLYLSSLKDDKAVEPSTTIPQPQQINTPPPSHQQEVISNVSDPLIDAMTPLVNMIPVIIGIVVITMVTFQVVNMFRGQYD